MSTQNLFLTFKLMIVSHSQKGTTAWSIRRWALCAPKGTFVRKENLRLNSHPPPIGGWIGEGLKSFYKSQRGKTKLSDYLDYSAGYFCNSAGIAKYKSNPCPYWNYCPQKYISAPFECPAGTYNSKTGVGKLSECLSCLISNYCPMASVYPIPSKMELSIHRV